MIPGKTGIAVLGITVDETRKSLPALVGWVFNRQNMEQPDVNRIDVIQPDVNRQTLSQTPVNRG